MIYNFLQGRKPGPGEGTRTFPGKYANCSFKRGQNVQEFIFQTEKQGLRDPVNELSDFIMCSFYDLTYFSVDTQHKLLSSIGTSAVCEFLATVLHILHV